MQVGKYECTRDLGGFGCSVVYAARLAGETTESYAVKCISLSSDVPPEMAADHPDLAQLLSDLTRPIEERVAFQRAAAESSQHVAPILDSGKEEGMVWYATRLYPTSLQKLVAKRISLSRDHILHLLRCITQGLVDLKTAGRRSHGNLKLCNVLLGEGEMHAAQIALTDPADGQRLDVARFEAADLRAIGEIIFQLVRRREISSASEFLLEDQVTKEWKAVFGRQSAQWHRLCSRLLDPNLSVENYRLENLQADLRALEPKKIITRKALIGSAIVLLASLLGGWLFYRMTSRGTLEVTMNLGPDLPAPDLPGKILDRTSKRLLALEPSLLIRPAQGKELTRRIQPGKALHEDLPVGSVEVVLTCPGFPAATNSTQISRKERAAVQFTNYCGVVELKSSQTGVEVVLEQKAVSATIGTLAKDVPLRFLMATGEVSLSFSQTSFTPEASIATLGAGKKLQVEVTLKPVAPDAQLVVVDCNLDTLPLDQLWDNVFIRNNQAGRDEKPYPRSSRDKTVSLSPGSYTAYVKFKDSYKELWGQPSVSFEVPGTSKVTLDVPVGFVEVKPIEPTNVQVAGAGAGQALMPLGSSADGALALKPGRYRVQMSAEGYDPLLKEGVEIAHRGTNTLAGFKLRRSTGTIAVSCNLPEPFRSQARFKTGDLPVLSDGGEFRPPPGRYTLVAEHPQLDSVTREVQVANAQVTNVFFVFAFGTLRITNPPPICQVKLDQVNKGSTSYFLLKAGKSYHLTVDTGDPGYQPDSGQNLLVSALTIGTNLVVEPKPMRRNVTVELSSDPPEASIAVSRPGKPVQTVKAGQSLPLPWERYTFTATHGGHGLDPVILSTNLAWSEQPYKIHFPFKYGTLVVTSYESGASVFDSQGKLVGTTPYSDPALHKPGTQLAYTLEGVGTQETTPLPLIIREGRNAHGVVFAKKFVRGLPNSIGLQFVWVPTPAELGGGAWPGKKETGIWVGRYEVRQIEYSKAVNGDWTPAKAPGEGKPADDLPAANLGWNEAAKFCSLMTGHDALKLNGWKFALPDEAQWRHFLADGMKEGLSVYNQGSCKPVGSKGANALGLCDVNGNVKEWLLKDAKQKKTLAGCSFMDQIHDDPVNTILDPGTDAAGNQKLGGDADYGFRVVVVPGK